MDAGREAMYNGSGAKAAHGLRVAATVVCAAVLGLGCVACRPPMQTPSVLKIGMAGSFEGLYRNAGYEALYAVKLAVAEWNEVLKLDPQSKSAKVYLQLVASKKP